MSAPPHLLQPRGHGLAVVALILSFLALALALAPFILAMRPVLSLACSVGALVCAIVGIICGHATWSRTRGSGWRAVVVVALILGYLALALGLFHILALFARELALRRRRAI
jgi:peptidoglycan biosynthesis protein MviN/MurJ (putative lipid II flippase)